MFVKSLLPFVVLALSLTDSVSSAAVRRRGGPCKPKTKIVQAVEGNGANFYPDISKLAGSVEGASVDAKGNIYAVDELNFISLNSGKTPNFKNLEGLSKPAFLASSRHTRTLGTLVGNAGEQSILITKGDGKFETFIQDKALVQPNDITIDRAEKRIFFTGQNYTQDSVSGKDGSVGCIDVATKKITRVPEEKLAAAGTFRINGIDLSPDEKYLYVTSQRNVNFTSTEQKVFRFKVPKTGCDLGKLEEWADLNKLLAKHGIVDDKKQMDPDGLRTDTKGRVYVALNAFGRVIKIHSPSKSEIIETPNIDNPANLEFGMEKGDHIVIVGRCSGVAGTEGNKKACVAYHGVDAVGRAFANLNGLIDENGVFQDKPKGSA